MRTIRQLLVFPLVLVTAMAAPAFADVQHLVPPGQLHGDGDRSGRRAGRQPRGHPRGARSARGSGRRHVDAPRSLARGGRDRDARRRGSRSGGERRADGQRAAGRWRVYRGDLDDDDHHHPAVGHHPDHRHQVIATLAAALSLAATVAMDVPYLPQTDALCGGAAAAMVFRYWGDVHADPAGVRADRRPARRRHCQRCVRRCRAAPRVADRGAGRRFGRPAGTARRPPAGRRPHRGSRSSISLRRRRG